VVDNYDKRSYATHGIQRLDPADLIQRQFPQSRG
jgi:hypothetical protein